MEPSIPRPMMIDSSGLPIANFIASSTTIVSSSTSTSTANSTPTSTAIIASLKTQKLMQVSQESLLWLLLSFLVCFLIYFALDLPRWYGRILASGCNKWLPRRFKNMKGGEIGEGWFFRRGKDGLVSLHSRNSSESPITQRSTEKDLVTQVRKRMEAIIEHEEKAEKSISLMDQVVVQFQSEKKKGNSSDDISSQAEISVYSQPYRQSSTKYIPQLEIDNIQQQQQQRRPTLDKTQVVGMNSWSPDSPTETSSPISVMNPSRQGSISSSGRNSWDQRASMTSVPLFARGRCDTTITLDSQSTPDKTSPPPHVQRLISHLPYSHRILLYTPFPRLLPSLTMMFIIVLMTYILLVAMSLFYRSDFNYHQLENPGGVDYYRSGVIALAQVPIIVALGGRNSIIRMLLGGGDNAAVQRVHKVLGRTVFLCTLLHMGLYIYKWVHANSFYKVSKMSIIVAGYASVGGLTLIVLTSLPFVRHRCYGLFTICHYIGMFAFLIGLAYHTKVAVPWVIASFILFGLEQLLRISKMRMMAAELTPLAGADTTMIKVDGLKEGWRAGQHLILTVPSLAFKIGPRAFGGHPFTIASAPDGTGIVLMAKNAGDWTNAIYEMAASTATSNEKGIGGVKTKVLIEGPYGGPGHTIFASYTSVLLIGAGSGITFPLGVARDLLHKAYAGQVRATTVDLVWIIRTQDIARPMIQELHALVEQAKRLEAERYKENATAFRVHVYITRSPACSPLDLLPMPFSQRRSTGDDSPVDSILSQQPSLSRIYRSGLEVTGRRPDVLDLVNRSTLEARGAGGANGCAVAVCGPMGLVTDVRQAVAAVEESTRLACGGIELHEAAFAL